MMIANGQARAVLRTVTGRVIEVDAWIGPGGSDLDLTVNVDGVCVFRRRLARVAAPDFDALAANACVPTDRRLDEHA